MHLFQLDILVSEDDYEMAVATLATHAADGFEEICHPTGEICFRVYDADRTRLDVLDGIIRNILPDARLCCTEKDVDDWLKSWRTGFQPVLCGTRFVVLPPWLEEQKTRYPDRLPICIEPKNAFGTGQHETTSLCLTLLSDLLDEKVLSPQTRFLDLGTGSGILAIGAARAGMSGIGLDIDDQAIDNARENAVLNGVEKKCTFRQGSLEEVQEEKFDLIFANILAEPLKHMAADLAHMRAPDGVLILSGLLTIQAASVRSVYETEHLSLRRQMEKGEWAALLF